MSPHYFYALRKTEKDKVSLKIKLEKRLPFADLNLVYATLDGERTKTFAVSWRDECNLLVSANHPSITGSL